MLDYRIFRLVFLATAVALSPLLCNFSIAQPAPIPINKKPTTIVPQDSSSKEKLTDSTFVEKAAAGGLAEVELSKIAVNKTQNKKIRKFAETMIKDHDAANAKLKQIASANHLQIPAKINTEQQKMLSELQSLSGADFDQTYVDIMKKDHDTTVGLFDNAAGEATLNAELRVFANQTLPTLRAHQKHAHALSDTIAVNSK